MWFQVGSVKSEADSFRSPSDVPNPEGIVWGIKDNLFSCSRDQTMICHSIARDGYKLRDRLPKTGMSFTVQTDMAMAANETRRSAADTANKSDVERVERSRNLQRSGPAAMRQVSALSSSIGVVSIDRVGSKVFGMLARHYSISNEAPEHSCLVNSKVRIVVSFTLLSQILNRIFSSGRRASWLAPDSTNLATLAKPPVHDRHTVVFRSAGRFRH